MDIQSPKTSTGMLTVDVAVEFTALATAAVAREKRARVLVDAFDAYTTIRQQHLEKHVQVAYHRCRLTPRVGGISLV